MSSKSIACSKGDITESRAEAIVNAANNHLWMGSGVAGAIKRKGGVEIETEAVSKGPVDIGEAVATGAGRLPQKYVIHAVAMGQDLRTDEEKIRRATRNSLLRAEELKLESIDFPALGTGVGGFPPEKAAEVMIDEARKFLRVSRFLKKVGFVLFDNETFECFKSELGAESASV
jgi:O-acetyl-ADP-ribose deacetylase (regulator of RNase III)